MSSALSNPRRDLGMTTHPIRKSFDTRSAFLGMLGLVLLSAIGCEHGKSESSPASPLEDRGDASASLASVATSVSGKLSGIDAGSMPPGTAATTVTMGGHPGVLGGALVSHAGATIGSEGFRDAVVVGAGHGGADTGGVGGSGGVGGTGGVAGLGGAGGSGGVGLDEAGTRDAGAGGQPGLELLGAPNIHSTTGMGFVINAVVLSGSPGDLEAYVKKPSDPSWNPLKDSIRMGDDYIEWQAAGLEPGTRYDYEISGWINGRDVTLYSGHVMTQRSPGSTFTFDVITDTHIPPPTIPLTNEMSNDSTMEATLWDIAPLVAADDPDFVINIGDVLDFHMFGFNEPPPDASWARLGYLNYRRALRDTLGNATHFPVIGNWDGENGCNTLDEIERSRSQRLLYLPGPAPDTYPEGGSSLEDYYAFAWGDALFIVLNVMTYTPTCHLLSAYPGLPDDWTLGEAQLAWFQQTLENATAKWRFVFIHHTVGGNAGDDNDSAYGRGGGRAAYVGEQAVVHELLQQYGVQIFFYGHDHVFTDMVVDGVHYTLPGSAGAPWKFNHEATGYDMFWEDSGYGRVTVSPDNVNVEFINMDADKLYSYELP